ncbi:MAG TPA: HlyD family efflux transporter periplasmic adaptor subunit [Chloroflexi bacterium]|jgi:HlyD family secretion protein|nr:HlyD family efflux transporter periplasmic adaptor subunit [Chloroflexota bacterium]
MSPRYRPGLTVALLIVVLVTTMGCSTSASTKREEATPTPIPPPPVPVKPMYTVQRGTVIDSLSFTGRVAPVIEEELFFREGGRAKRVYVERNDMVEAGTLLAELENDDLVRQLQQAEIQLETDQLNLQAALDAKQFSVDKARIDLEIKRLELAKKQQEAAANVGVIVAKANLDKAIAGPSETDLAIARDRIEQAKNSLWGAQNQRDAICGQDADSAACRGAQASVQNGELNVRIAELQYQELQKGSRPEDVAIAQANYQSAVLRQQQLLSDIEIMKQEIALAERELERLEEGSETNLEAAVGRSKLAVERLQAQLAATQIFSPIAGKVTSVSCYEGREVNAYSPVFVVADEAEIEVTAEPMSTQLQRLAEGMEASIILSAYPGKELPAEIIQLPYPYGGGGGATVEEADKLTHIAFDPQDLDLKPGDLVKVIVTIEQRDDVLWLPPAAIRTFAGRKFVEIDEDGTRKRVDVVLGIESAERVEIREGLEEGQTVVGQ